MSHPDTMEGFSPINQGTQPRLAKAALWPGNTSFAALPKYGRPGFSLTLAGTGPRVSALFWGKSERSSGMAAKSLESLTVVQLKEMARKKGFSGYSRLTRPELLSLLTQPENRKQAEKVKPSRRTASNAAGTTDKVKPEIKKKTRTKTLLASETHSQPAPLTAKLQPANTLPSQTLPEKSYEPFDEHRQLVFSYDRAKCVLMLKNPDWLFVYWDYDASLEQRISKEAGSGAIRLIRNGVRSEVLRVDLPSRRMYIRNDGSPGTLRVELGGSFGREFIPFLTSNTVELIRSAPSSDEGLEFTVPEWLEAGAETPRGPLTRQEWERLYGPVPVDVPWYLPPHLRARRK